MSNKKKVGVKEPETKLSPEEVLAITRDWDSTNKRRHELIEKKISKQITPQEDEELLRLQKLAGMKRQLVMPLPTQALIEVETSLRKRGL